MAAQGRFFYTPRLVFVVLCIRGFLAGDTDNDEPNSGNPNNLGTEVRDVTSYTLYCSSDHDRCCDRLFINTPDSVPGVTVTASSSYVNPNHPNHNHGPDRAELFEISDYSYNPDGGTSGWAAARSDANQWIQVDFGNKLYKVTGLLLQGRVRSDQWVTKFRVLFSNDGNVFYSTEVMEGTFDRNTVSRRYFDRTIVARYVRFVPVTWHGHITVRFDLLGCRA